MNTTWIKRSEREPTEADLPIVMGGYMCGSGKAWDIALYACLPPKSHWSGYWRSIKAEPPPRELTQREKDEEAAKKAAQWSYDHPGEPGAYALVSAREAIYAERREVLALLNQIWAPHWGPGSALIPVRQLRARLDEQGAK